MKFTSEKKRQRIRWRIRSKVKGSSERPRLSVYRSNKAIYAQIVDDLEGITICAASSRDNGIDTSVNKTEQAKLVGKALADKAKASGIDSVVFDRGGYLYHGRVKALADGAREQGLNF